MTDSALHYYRRDILDPSGLVVAMLVYAVPEAPKSQRSSLVHCVVSCPAGYFYHRNRLETGGPSFTGSIGEVQIPRREFRAWTEVSESVALVMSPRIVAFARERLGSAAGR